MFIIDMPLSCCGFKLLSGRCFSIVWTRFYFWFKKKAAVTISLGRFNYCGRRRKILGRQCAYIWFQGWQIFEIWLKMKWNFLDICRDIQWDVREKLNCVNKVNHKLVLNNINHTHFFIGTSSTFEWEKKERKKKQFKPNHMEN